MAYSLFKRNISIIFLQYFLSFFIYLRLHSKFDPVPYPQLFTLMEVCTYMHLESLY